MAYYSTLFLLFYAYSAVAHYFYDYENDVRATYELVYPQIEKMKQYQVNKQTQVKTEIPRKCGVSAGSEKSDEFDDMYNNYRNLLLSDNYDKTNEAVVKYVHALSIKAKLNYKILDQSPARKMLWPDEVTQKRSDDLKTQFQNLRPLALAYGTNGTIFYKSERILLVIKDCLEFLISPGQYDGKIRYGNWWNWQIGIPTNFLDILVIIKNKLTVKKLDHYTNIISTYVPNVYRKFNTTLDNEVYPVEFSDFKVSSSQKMELGRTVLGLGILQKDDTKIYETLDAIAQIMGPVTKLDGFYKDGSFIEHKNVPYTGTYGNELVKKMNDILEISRSSKYANPFLVGPIVQCVERAFLPLIYRGEIVAPVRGREVSREPATLQIGSHVMYTLLTMASFASAKSKKTLKESAKYWIKQNKDYYYTSARTYNDLKLTISVLKDPTIVGDKLPFIGAKMYASMDRFIQQTDNYTLALSLYSSRISAFEAGDTENKRGWHTADGAMYLYNYDDVQFRNNYWPTVDPYRIPGTTVDTVPLSDELGTKWESFLSTEEWVGGVASGSQAVVGMALNKKGFRNNQIMPMNLEGKKSWFILDGQIVALGAGITGTTKASIETIVDNRLLNDKYQHEVWSNYGLIKEDTKEYYVNWLLLQSDNKHSSIGYYFPNSQTVNAIFETRHGTYKDINAKYSKKGIKYQGSYRKFIIDHGQRPVNAYYAYVVLPGITKSDLKNYTKNKVINILANSRRIQAVETINGGYLGINIWSETGGEIKGISSNKPISIMRLTDGLQQTYVLADPTQSEGVITVKINDCFRVVATSGGVEYDDINNRFLIDFEETAGAAKQIIIMIIEEMNEIDTTQLNLK